MSTWEIGGAIPDTKKTGGGAGLGRVYFWAHFEDPELEGAWI